MNKKAIIALLSALVLTVVASVTLILTVGRKANADTEIVTVPVEYLKIQNGVLGDGSDGGAFTADGKTWIAGKQYHVEIPDTVTTIGDRAFCVCSGLTSITIPSSVTSIGYNAFYNCSGLTNITIPSTVTSISDWAFGYCSGLTSITVDPNNTTYTSQDNNGNECNCIIQKSNNTLISGCQNTTIPSSVTSIGNRAFCGCSGLTSITIPSSVTSIGNSAFQGCSGLTSITIPSSVTSISDSAFQGCSGLTSITIPSSVTSIGYNAFQGCSGLTSITIPSSVTSIGYNAFYNCSGLTSITVDPNNTTYTSQDNNGNECNCIIQKSNNTLINGCRNTTIPSSVTSIGKNAFYNCSGLTNITIPSSVTTIGDYAFFNCYRLTSITISSGVTSIGANAFAGCSGLTNIEIPSSVTSIGKNAFQSCSELKSIEIPSGVTSIGDFAFQSCRWLKNIIIPSSVTSIGSNAFQGCSRLTNITVGSLALLNHSALSSYKSKGYVHYYLMVTFDNGSSVDTETVDYKKKVIAPSDPIREGYTFNGWLLNGQPYNFTSPVTDNITLTADWKAPCTVTFNSNGGSSVDSQTVDYNAVISAPVTRRTGYTFQGWLLNGVVYDFSNPIVENMDLVADWTINQYTVTFDSCNGAELKTESVEYNNKVTKPSDPEDTQTANFKGWYRDLQDAESFDFNTLITENITLFAKWENVYVVAFNVDGGTAVAAQQIENGQKAEQPTTPSKMGYTFAGWYTNANFDEEYDFDTVINGSRTIYAKWTINQYTVTFNTNGGSVVDSQTVDFGSRIIDHPTSKQGYTFSGWLLNGQPYDSNTPVTDNLTLTADWTIKQYTVTFNTNGGSAVDEQIIKYEKVVTEPANPIREGYTFKGWYNGETAYDFNTPVTDNLTLTAQWEAIPEPEETNPETPTEKENTEVKENKNNGAVVAAVAGTCGVASIAVIGVVIGVVLKKRRK